MQITEQVGPHRHALIELAAAASASYDAFAYEDGKQAAACHRLLFDQGVSEYSPPHCRLLVDDGALIGMVAAMTLSDLTSTRLRAAMVLSRADGFGAGSDLRRRMQLAGRTFMAVREGDCCVTRLAVSPAARGRGCGQRLLEQVEAEACERGLERLTLDVSPGHQAAIRLYERLGFEHVGRGETTDEQTGRALTHLHMAKALRSPAAGP